jgi:hypothetical protein
MQLIDLKSVLSQRLSARSLPSLIAWWAATLLLVFLAIPAHAQYRASLRGTVADPTGAVIPGATVTLTDKDTNATRTATSDGSGIYTFNALPPDHFSLVAERQGFEKKEVAQVVLIPEQPNTLDVQLQLGDVQQTVTVTGSAAPLLDSGTATVSATISSNEIQHMPSYDRDVFQLAQLAPGVFGDGSQGSGGGSLGLPGNQGPGGPGAGAAGIFSTENGPQIQTRGSQYETNGISIDGISTVSAVWGGTSVISPSEDSVGDMKIVSNSYDAEVGRFSGGQIEVTTQSGTNALHGSLFFKASRPGLNAYQRWNGLGSDVAGTPATRGLNKDDERTNNYGASLGGPIWKNRLFAFFNMEESPSAATTTAQGWYDTPEFDQLAVPSGSIASKYLSFPGEGVSTNGLIQRTCSQIALVEGVNCATESDGLNVGSLLTGVALGTQDPTWKNTGNPGVGGGLSTVPDIGFFNTVTPSTASQFQYNGRLDADATHNDHLSFAIYWVPVTTTFYNGPARSANLWHHSQVNDAFSVIWNHTFSPTLVNQARGNAAGWRWNEVATNPQEPFGLPTDSIGGIGGAGVSYFGAPGPSNLNQWTYDYNDVLTKILGRHSIKAGGDLTRLYYLNNAVYAARPNFFFNNLWDFANDAPWSEGGEFNSATGVPFSNREDNRSDIYGVFVQDDYKIRPNLTINAGLRWSYFSAYDSKENNLDVVKFGSGADVLTGLNIRVGGGLYTPQKSNFGPQLGFAWQPKESVDRLVVRGGFGINFNQNEIAITANGFGNPPNAVTPNFSIAAGTGADILYQTATSINSIFGYPPNLAAITTFGANNLPLTPGGTGVTAYPSNPKTIVNYHYSLDTQYQWPYQMVASLGYQGSQSRHLLVQSNFNVIVAGNGGALNPAANSIDYYANTGTGNYNAMIATLKHNFAHQFNLEAQYTWAKTMDDTSGPYSEDFYPWDSQAAYERSDYNVGNAFKIFGMWQPVIFHGQHGAAEKVAGGWSLSGIYNLHTGFPWSPIYNLNFGSVCCGLIYSSSGYGQLRPAAYLGGAGTKTSNSTFMQKNNPNYQGNGTTYFQPPTFVPGAVFPATSPAPTPGIHSNSLNGPGYSDLDTTLSKAFGLPHIRGLGEDPKFELRVDVFNLFNKLNVTGIDNNLGTINTDGTVNSVNTDFGVAGGGLGSRTVQLQARFSF